MLKPSHVSYIVARTLQRMGVNEPSVEKLIKGTFAIESNLESLFDYSNPKHPKHGLMLLSEIELRDLIQEYLRFKSMMCDNILNATGIDIVNENIDHLIGEVDSNIALMTVILYVYYTRQYSDIPEDNINDIAKFYRKYFKKVSDLSVQDAFLDKYKKTFLK